MIHEIISSVLRFSTCLLYQVILMIRFPKNKFNAVKAEHLHDIVCLAQNIMALLYISCVSIVSLILYS
jgi:hypothetical protein